MNIENLFNQFCDKRIAVVGDVMVDAYMIGLVDRVSPEAPVPIVRLQKTDSRLGGAANVALNLLSLGATPILCGVVGSDGGGNNFRALMNKRGLSEDGLISSASRTTTVKTRVIGNKQQLIRIDEEELHYINTSEEDQLIERIREQISMGLDAIILEDYNKGLLTERVISEIIRIANSANIPVTVDPKKENFFAYKGATLFKPNLKELKEGLGLEFDFVGEKHKFEDAVLQLEQKLNNNMTMITLSEHGVFIKYGENKDYVPAHVRNISDVSGAGDTVIAVATLCLASGLSPAEIADISNLAGGLVCELSGVVPINKEAFAEELTKLLTA